MIGAVGAYQPIFAIAATAATGGSGDMAIEPPALQPEVVTIPEVPPQEPLTDPIGESIAASQMYPQLMVGSAYTGVSTDAVLPVEDDAVGTTDNDNRDDAMGQLLFGDGGQQPEEEIEQPEIMGDPARANPEAEEEEAASRESAEAGPKGKDGQALSQDEMAMVKELANRDREVRAHEQAHKSVGGQYSGGMSFSYQEGPDGQRYAVGGEVSIDTSTENTPEATISKMQQVRAAAMAPADPSPQDHAVAAAAMAAESMARAEAASQAQAEQADDGEDATADEQSADATESTTRSNGTDAIDRAEQAVANSDTDRYSASRIAPSTNSPTDSAQSLQNRFGAGPMSMAYRSIDIVA